MEQKKPPLKPGLWLALGIVAVTVVLSSMAYADPRSFLNNIIFPFTIHHWFSVIGGTFILGVYTSFLLPETPRQGALPGIYDGSRLRNPLIHNVNLHPFRVAPGNAQEPDYELGDRPASLYLDSFHACHGLQLAFSGIAEVPEAFPFAPYEFPGGVFLDYLFSCASRYSHSLMRVDSLCLDYL